MNLETHKKTSLKGEPGNVDESKVRHAITIARSPTEVFRYWRNFENLGLFMKDVKEVRTVSEKRSHWTVELESGTSVEWDAEITVEIPGKLLAWSSLKNSEVETSGIVIFEPAPGDRGTVVRLTMDYDIPGGRLAEWITRMTDESPDRLAVINLKRLKALLETGEIPTVKGQPSGRNGAKSVELKH